MGTLKILDATVEPLTLAEAKLHLRVDGNTEDALITALITATRQAAEFRCQRTLLQTTWELTQDAFTDALRLQYPRLMAVESVKYLDTAGVLQTLANTEYLVDADSEPGYVVPSGNGWPGTFNQINAVKVRYTAGYGTTADKVPQPIKQWMLLHIGHYYRNREASVGAGMQSLPYADGLLDEYRIWLL